MTAERDRSPQPLVVRWDLETSIRQLGRRAKVAIFIGLGAAAAVVALIVLRAVKPITDELESFRKQSEAAQESLRPIALPQLARIEPGRRRGVDVNPPPGGFEGFDPVAGLDWVFSIARAWVSDAALERIEGGPIAHEGTLNLSSKGEALISYDFLSSARLAEWDREADLQRDFTVDYRLELTITGGRVTATVIRGRPRNIRVPPAEPLLSVGELLTRAGQNGFPQRPFYIGILRYLPREGWQWQLQTPTKRESFPRLRATDATIRRLSREIHFSPGCRRRLGRRKATSDAPPAQGASGPRAVGDPVHARTHRAREPGGRCGPRRRASQAAS